MERRAVRGRDGHLTTRAFPSAYWLRVIGYKNDPSLREMWSTCKLVQSRCQCVVWIVEKYDIDRVWLTIWHLKNTEEKKNIENQFTYTDWIGRWLLSIASATASRSQWKRKLNPSTTAIEGLNFFMMIGVSSYPAPFPAWLLHLIRFELEAWSFGVL